MKKKRPAPEEKDVRKLLRFFADSSLQAEIEEIHRQLSTKKLPGGTIERLVKAGLKMLQGDELEIAPDILEMRRQLGKRNRTPAAVTIDAGGDMVGRVQELTDQVKAQGAQVAALLEKLEKIPMGSAQGNRARRS